MDFKVLCVGDVVGNPGMDRIRRSLRYLKRKTEADFVIVNGENAAVVGMTPQQGEDILDAGADCITMGNHTWGKREIVSYLDDCPQIIRPANYAPQCPGVGDVVINTDFGKVRVINLLGRYGLDTNTDNPFVVVDDMLREPAADIVLVDFHAEATSEKVAMGHFLDGRVSAVWGTHTHVQTSDAMVLPNGTGYITDLGMTGPIHSVIGVAPDQSIGKFLGDPPRRYDPATGAAKLEGCVFTIEAETGICIAAEHIRLK